MKGSRADLWLAICAIIGAAVYLYADALLPVMRIGGPLGPKAFPALVGIGIIFSALLLLRETWKKRGAAPTRTIFDDALPAGMGSNYGSLTPILLAMVAWTALYYFCFERVGYLIATIVFLLGLLSYFHRGHYVANCAIAVIFTLIVDLLFSHFLNVPMPAGWLSI